MSTALPNPRDPATAADPPATPPASVCEQARLSRDPRLDGLFFTAVTSTGIYCRPVCPARAPRREHVRYYGSAAAAECAGFRPCLRCRPELAPGSGWRRGDDAVTRALALIDAGALQDGSLADLAQAVHLGERQLRRLFVDRLGAPPLRVHGTRRLLFAKQLLTETALPITDLALAAGFGSLRRFNAAFQASYGMPPSRLRQAPRAARDDTLTLRLGYRPPYDFPAMLAFLHGRALPGIEHVDADSYRRAFSIDGAAGWLQLSAWPGEHALRLQLHGAPPARLLDIVTRLRRMFDLDSDPAAIAAALAHDPRLRALVARHAGLRLPSGWDGFEIAMRAVLGQQVSVAAARTLATRLVDRFGTRLATAGRVAADAGEVPATQAAPGPDRADRRSRAMPPDRNVLLDRAFPTPAALVDADLGTIGLTRARADTVRAVARAVLDGRVRFRIDSSLDAFVAAWTALPGIGAWTAHYIAMRALGHPDAFPADDLILRRAAADPGETLNARALTQRAEAWRPWRAYAVLHLWRSASATTGVAVTAATSTPRTAKRPA